MNRTNPLTATAPGEGAEAGTATSGHKSACLPDYSLDQVRFQPPPALVYEPDPIYQAERCELQPRMFELMAEFWWITAALDNQTGKAAK